MLTLDRKQGERIMIGDDIVLTVVWIRGDRCRIGIEAPKEIGVHREEVYESIAERGYGYVKAGGRRED